MPTDESWPFDQPPDHGAVTLRSILEGVEPILLVFHDADDHGWQFLGDGQPDVDDGALACLSHLLELDPGLRAVASMPPGRYACRTSRDAPWTFGDIDELDTWD
jgi:hypothetical protein